jgi:hypothetical protein
MSNYSRITIKRHTVIDPVKEPFWWGTPLDELEHPGGCALFNVIEQS